MDVTENPQNQQRPENQQDRHDPETEEDTASGGPADPPSGGHD